MYKLKEDRFYEILKNYNRICIEYVLLKDDDPYQDEISHRKALSYSMSMIAREENMPWNERIAEAKAKLIAVGDLLAVPEKPWKHNVHGTVLYDDVFEDGKIPYWYAFLEPPHGTGAVIENGKVIRNEYGTEDFKIVNDTLFPEGTDSLIVYEWTTDWSEYFADGHEWWGAACWSVYDRNLDRYVVILVSATD